VQIHRLTLLSPSQVTRIGYSLPEAARHECLSEDSHKG
jgi:hypothetical protein